MFNIQLGRLLPSQAMLIQAQDREILLSGSYGSGKTRSICMKGLHLSAAYPGNRGLVCRKQLMAVRATTLKTLLEGDGSTPAVLPEEAISNHHRGDRVITLRNGSEVLYGGLGRVEDINWIKSLTLGWVAVDQAEELSESDWMLLLGRLRLDTPELRQLFGACNPAHPGHWLYQRFYKAGQGRVIESNSLENPYLPADYLDILNGFRGRYRERYVLGRWTSFEGQVWPNYDPRVHLINGFELPPAWRRIRAVDFGYVHPFVCLWLAQVGASMTLPDGTWIPEGSLIVYREWHRTQWTVARHAERIRDLTAGEAIEATVCDHDAEDRATLEENGVPTQPADKRVSVGLQAVERRLGNYRVEPATGELVDSGGDYIVPTLFVFRDALMEADPVLRYGDGGSSAAPLWLDEEIQAYVWNERKDEPVKAHDHSCDALRYGTMYFGGHVPLVAMGSLTQPRPFGRWGVARAEEEPAVSRQEGPRSRDIGVGSQAPSRWKRRR